MRSPVLSVVIPAYNEETRLGETLQKIATYMQAHQVPFELLVVDDASEDGTYALAESLAPAHAEDWHLRVLRNEVNRGKGYSIRRGMLESRGRYALMTDADLSTPIEEIQKLEKEVAHGAFQIALGSRDLPGYRVELHQSRFRELSGKIFNRFMRLITGLPFRDTQCGFKLFDMQFCRDIFNHQQIEGFGFDVEILYIARKWNLRMTEVPVVWRHAAGSKVDFIRDATRMLMDLFRIRANDWRGLYRPPGEGPLRRP